jgi:beta-lactamase class D
VRDENEVIKWDGVKREFLEWNQDQTMRTAIKYSSVWFYQELARRIGQEQMQRYVTLANYGNQDISGGIDLFVGMWATWSVVIMPISLLLILTSLNQMT